MAQEKAAGPKARFLVDMTDNTMEVARQLTLLDQAGTARTAMHASSAQEQFRAIGAEEFLQSFVKLEEEEVWHVRGCGCMTTSAQLNFKDVKRTNNLEQYVNFFNRLRWVLCMRTGNSYLLQLPGGHGGPDVAEEGSRPRP